MDRYLEELTRSSHVDRPEIACFFEINRDIFERVRDAVCKVRFEGKEVIRRVVRGVRALHSNVTKTLTPTLEHRYTKHGPRRSIFLR